MSKKFKKIWKKVDPIMGGDVILDKLGLPSLGGEKNGLFAQPEMAATGSTAAPAMAPTAVSDETMDAREAMRKRQLAAAGMSGTVLTSSSGLSGGANTAGKSLLGS
jgi:hypothetical protein